MSEIVSLLKELIKFQTISSNPEQIEKCADFIENYLKNIDIKYSRIEHNSIPSIIVTPDSNYAPVLLMAHFDVVKADSNLFVPCEKDGRLYGRGSIDDKYAVAVSLVLLKTWMKKLQKKNLGQESLPFGIILTSDEESGGFNGAKQCLKNVKSSFAIALDGGAPEEIVVKEKGILQLKLEATGKAAHGARPWLGENAIDALAEDIIKVKSLFNDKNKDHWHKTMNTGIIRAGSSINQVPDSAYALIDIRYTENDDPEKIASMMDQETRSSVKIQRIEPLFISQESEYLKTLMSLIPDAKTCFEHGASDARFLQEHNIPGIIWGAQGNMTQHAQDEHIEIQSIQSLFDILDKFLARVSINMLTHKPG